MSEKPTTTKLTLEEVRLQFENWREAKKGNDRIPSNQWLAAVDLTKSHTPHKIAKSLGLNCMRLKIRVNASEAALPIDKEASGAMDPALEEVRLQFENWREGKGVNERIPEDLWQAAAGIVRTYFPGKVARPLDLNPLRLRKRGSAVEVSLPANKDPVASTDLALEKIRIQFEIWREAWKGLKPISKDFSPLRSPILSI